MDCIFCKIAKGEIPCFKVFEDGNHLAFLDISPCSDGHTVVIPKKHSVSFLDLNEKEAGELFSFVNAVSKKIYDPLSADGLTIGSNIYESAGQTVMHTHIHIIPRYEGDGGGSTHSVVCSAQSSDMNFLAQIHKKITESSRAE
ncbi:HIT family protein [Methanolapillus ohkumae]|uniref:HIT domain-containing protein n=1 Tax=Methanolapillus ohkumae TaxID=3028298 RepID=A0AA96V6Z1_9EURY|nr:hypothetical protein MsAm2_04730 [Methanosarcinaceae archaeon Am2]